MTLSILLAAGAQQQGQSGGSMGFLIMMIAIFAIMWLFMIRPQQKKQKETRKFQNALEPGVNVVTGGGIYGVVKRVDPNGGKIEVEIARGVVITVDKGYVFPDAQASQLQQQQSK